MLRNLPRPSQEIKLKSSLDQMEQKFEELGGRNPSKDPQDLPRLVATFSQMLALQRKVLAQVYPVTWEVVKYTLIRMAKSKFFH